MAEHEDPMEGWQVRLGIGARAAVALPVVLLIALFAGGWWYDHDLRPSIHRVVVPFPAPGLETQIAHATHDPDLAPVPARPDPALQRAKAETVAAGWGGAR